MSTKRDKNSSLAHNLTQESLKQDESPSVTNEVGGLDEEPADHRHEQQQMDQQ